MIHLMPAAGFRIEPDAIRLAMDVLKRLSGRALSAARIAEHTPSIIMSPGSFPRTQIRLGAGAPTPPEGCPFDDRKSAMTTWTPRLPRSLYGVPITDKAHCVI